jgi:poly(A) polymerase
MLGIQRLAFELTLESKKKGYLSQARFLFQKNKHHIMPIITPAYPSMCSTHNILQSTMKVLLAELTRASTIVDKIILGTTTWQELFVEHNFFELYKHYIRISVCSNMPDLQISWQVQPL